MKTGNPTAVRRRYLAHAIETASPASRLTMLFDALELDLLRADLAFESGDLKSINDNLVHAQEIILCLRDTMQPDVWDSAGQMIALHNFFLAELLGANLDKNRERAAAVATLISRVADAWRQAAERVSGRRGATP